MGTLTLAQLRSEVRFDIKNRSDTSSSGFSDARVNLFINAALQHICHPTVFRHQAMKHRFTIALATSTSTYTFSPVSSVTITGIRWGSYVAGTSDLATTQRQRLVPKDETWFENRTLTSGGPPREYYVRNHTTLAVNPVPTATENGNLLVFGAWREPAALALNADTTTLPTAWDEILILAARWRAELHLGYREMAELTKLDFTSLVNEYESFDRLHGEDDEWRADLRGDAYQGAA